MGHKYQELAFTPTVRAVQDVIGSRKAYAKRETGDDFNDKLGPDEAAFIAARDSFYMATVSETGWPYMQHRGGPKGFLQVIDEKTIGFADFSGNRQYISVGNLMKDNRVSLFLMDYALKARLKILGHVELIDADQPEMLKRLTVPDYRARIERGMIIKIAAFDWNCPQHITPRFTAQEVEAATTELQARIADLRAQVARLEGGTTGTQ